MPIHLGAMTNDSDNASILAWIFSQAGNSELGFASKDSNYFHFFKPLMDTISGRQVGRIVFTLKNNEAEKTLEILDVDMFFENPQSVDISFLSRREGSSDSNEYYDVEFMNGRDGHMAIETVNRHMIEGDIEGTTQSVHLCAFPFKLSLYDSMDELNKALGFSQPIKVKGTDYEVNGFSEEFAAPGDAFGAQEGETFSFIIGKIYDYKEVQLQMDEDRLSFILASVITGAGVMPVPMSKDVFNLQKLHGGAYVAMHADVKADFADAYQKNIVTGSNGVTENQTSSNDKKTDTGFWSKLRKKLGK